MKMAKRISATLALSTLSVALLAGCGNQAGKPANGQITGTQTATASTTPKDTLVVAMSGGVDTFDPAFEVGSTPVQTVIQNTFDQLTQYKLKDTTIPSGQTIGVADTSKVVGMLAESYSVSPDGKTLTFKIRPNLHYQNGDPLNAETIAKGAYERTFGVQGVATFLLSMAGVSKADQVSAPNPSTLVIHLTQPNPLFLMNDTMLNTSALDPKQIQANATTGDPWAKAWFQKNLGSGNGPFQLDSYEPGSKLVMSSYKNYWQGAAKLNKVVILDTPDATQRVQLLEHGQVDMIQDPPLNDLSKLSKEPGISVYSTPSTRVQMLELNTTQAPFNNVLVRQAFAYAIPYNELIQNVMHGYAQPATSLVPTGMPTHDGSYWPYQTDLKKAAALLAQAGFPNGKGLPPITLTVKTGTTEDEQTAVFVQASLQQLGVNLQIKSLPLATYNQLEQSGKLQFWDDDWISWVNDPFYHMSWIVSSTSPTDYTHYKNPTVDSLIAKYTLSSDTQGRDAASKQIQKILGQDVPLIYLYQPNFNVAMRSNVYGYTYYNDQLFRFYTMGKK